MRIAKKIIEIVVHDEWHSILINSRKAWADIAGIMRHLELEAM